jgi:Mg-chelatase subunit ChlD
MAGRAGAAAAAGRDLMLAVDISGSMREEDMLIGNQVVDRLTAVKAVAGDFIERREGDRIGLILFGQQAYLQTPLTFDRATARTLLFESAVGLAGRETAIGDAIGLAVKRLRDAPAAERVLVLLTDGANTAGSIAPLKAAELANEAGMRIHTIGVGGDPRSAFGLTMGRAIRSTRARCGRSPRPPAGATSAPATCASCRPSTACSTSWSRCSRTSRPFARSMSCSAGPWPRRCCSAR